MSKIMLLSILSHVECAVSSRFTYIRIYADDQIDDRLHICENM